MTDRLHFTLFRPPRLLFLKGTLSSFFFFEEGGPPPPVFLLLCFASALALKPAKNVSNSWFRVLFLGSPGGALALPGLSPGIEWEGFPSSLRLWLSMYTLSLFLKGLEVVVAAWVFILRGFELTKLFGALLWSWLSRRTRMGASPLGA